MICDKCKIREAIINVIGISKGEEKSLWLCDNCAKELMQFPKSKEESIEEKFQGILNGFLQTVNTSKRNSELEELTCVNCGITYKSFKNTGMVGCKECYQTFNTQMRPVIKRVHGDLEHIGKIPRRAGGEIAKSKVIKKLKDELQRAIIEEEYEKAAIVRDKLKEIDKSGELNGKLD